MTSDLLRELFDAGFTPEEIRSIAADLEFGAIAVRESGKSIRISGAGVEWTPEKRAAWNKAVGEFLGHVRHPDNEDPETP